ncbi:Permuted papain-like amidase enzyme, YaeF/YiiX, C92 family [Belliella buryatensis]|uniref:Permuted papain-like amidase enzyme, YaeF/YiiX, C92 family n=1 Tax=Belliella buryatensis TaxID=1500549 RepID=A0A239GPT3_9BACT|nr:YiiX/YebB-like N1pC/P60 family cysteine hydrolase [Belliella buryatensis]SNS70832.1 Permuted papain-like amidase enzyme, YaeF/YiiX, C92 family [Belliella buryatensis]
MIKRALFVFGLTLIFLASCRQQEFWQEGDILFQDGDCGDFCDAIRKVTQGYQGRDFSHNGLLIQEEGRWYVLEAIGTGVTKTPLDDFLNKHLDGEGKPKVMVGRLKSEYQDLVPKAIEEAKKHLGKPYDSVFDFENEAYYCSELIHFAFKAANGGEDLFTPKPMTYKDPDTGELFPIWINYFEKLNVEIPEGKLGLNPGGMSLESVLEMLELPM